MENRDKENIILLGKGKGWELCPQNTNKEIWALNGFLFDKKINTRIDRIFMMDIVDEMPSVVAGYWDEKKIVEKANELGIPFVAPYRYDEIPNSIAFPMEECIKQFGTPYFNNTIAYMIAYALMKGVKSIEIYGINQASGSEYFYEKGCVEFWLGVAVGKNLEIKINGQWSELLVNKARYGGNLLYGYNLQYEEWIRQRKFGEKTIKLIKPLVQTKVQDIVPDKNSQTLQEVISNPKVVSLEDKLKLIK